MLRKLEEYLAQRKHLREERRARKKRRRKYKHREFTAEKLREYPKTLELVQAAREEGATHFVYIHREFVVNFYRMKGDTLQFCQVSFPFLRKATRSSWKRVLSRYELLKNTLARIKGKPAASLPVRIESTGEEITYEERLKRWLLENPSSTPEIPPTAQAIELLFKPVSPVNEQV
jgi:hypothetical protein